MRSTPKFTGKIGTHVPPNGLQIGITIGTNRGPIEFTVEARYMTDILAALLKAAAEADEIRQASRG